MCWSSGTMCHICCDLHAMLISHLIEEKEAESTVYPKRGGTVKGDQDQTCCRSESTWSSGMELVMALPMTPSIRPARVSSSSNCDSNFPRISVIWRYFGRDCVCQKEGETSTAHQRRETADRPHLFKVHISHCFIQPLCYRAHLLCHLKSVMNRDSVSEL